MHVASNAHRQYAIELKTRKEDLSLMNAFQRRSFKLDDPVEQGTSCYRQDEDGSGDQYDTQPTTALERQKHHTTAINFTFL